MLHSEIYDALDKEHAEASESVDKGKIAEICHRFETLLNERIADPAILFKIGTCKHQLGLNGSAISFLSNACMLKQDAPEFWNNLASAWKAENHDDRAKQCWEEAIKIQPRAEHYNNLGTLYVNIGNPEPGIAYLQKALEMEPDMARAKWNMALLNLEMGNWKEGLDLYEYGIPSRDRPTREYAEGGTPWWNGESGTVVCYGEQGLGDEIMWSSCLPDIIEEADDLIVECHPRLKELMRRSFPGVTFYGTRKDPRLSWPMKHPPDYKIPIGSLFKRYRPDGVFPKVPYLIPDPERTEFYRQKLREAGDPPYIGIAWLAGNKSTRNDLRSFKLGWFDPIFEAAEATWVSLQYTEEAEGKVQRHKESTGRTIHHWREALNGGGKYHDYDETVSLINALDLCILPNTTAVHLCGAIGKECWTLTPKGCAWRYQLTGDRMPFYGDWITQVREQEQWAETVADMLRSWVTDRQFSKSG